MTKDDYTKLYVKYTTLLGAALCIVNWYYIPFHMPGSRANALARLCYNRLAEHSQAALPKVPLTTKLSAGEKVYIRETETKFGRGLVKRRACSQCYCVPFSWRRRYRSWG